MSRNIESAVTKSRPGRSRFGIGAILVVLAVSMVVAAGLSELVVRVARPGFPGFRVPQIEHRPVPGLGFEMVPNQVGYSTASRVTVNAAGFRGHEIRNAAGEDLRVLCLGDSMTFGVSVEDNETYPERLEQLLTRVTGTHPEVINAGVQRYFTFQEIDLLKGQVEKLRPDVVTLAVYVNDLGVRPANEDFVREYENEREQSATAFRRRFPLTYITLKNSALLELAKNTYLMLNESRRTRPNIVQDALAGRVRPRDEPKWRGLEQELVTFKQLSQAHNFHPIVLFVPVRATLEKDFPASLYPRRLLEHARSVGIDTIDLSDPFRQSLRAGNDPFLPWDDHMSVAGHQLVAQAIAMQIGRVALPRVERASRAVASHPAEGRE